LDNVDDQEIEQQQPAKPALKMRGLPYSVTEDDIIQFFHGFGLIEDSIRIGKMPTGKLTGEACVLFETTEDAKLAYQDRYKQYIGSRFIELF
jgi:RNA recognition motif-containing protein